MSSFDIKEEYVVMDNITNCLVSIRSNNKDDQYDRYKMPDIIFRQKNEGQYNHTYITKLSDICKSLKIADVYLVRYMGIHLNTNSQFDEVNKILSLKGYFSKKDLTTCLRDFINQYVLCVKCDLPELDYLVDKKMIKIRCRSCGHSERSDKNDRIYKQMHISLCAKKTEEVSKLPPKKEEEEIDWFLDSSTSAAKLRLSDQIGNNKLVAKLIKTEFE